MKKLLNSLPFLIVVILLFVSCSEGNLNTTTVNPQPSTVVNAAVNLPEYKVVPGSVYDGDTIRVAPVNINGYPRDQQLKIRFACIDAPERSQPGGIEARDELKKILADGGDRVQLNIITTDRYGRSVAEVWSNGGLVQSQLAQLGYVYPYERYKSDCPSWDAVEKAGDYAIANRLGVHNNPNAIKPWEYRRR